MLKGLEASHDLLVRIDEMIGSEFVSSLIPGFPSINPASVYKVSDDAWNAVSEALLEWVEVNPNLEISLDDLLAILENSKEVEASRISYRELKNHLIAVEENANTLLTEWQKLMVSSWS